MNRAKKLIGMLVAAAVLTAVPLTAMALPAGGYVPTSGTRYTLDEKTKKWVKDATISSTYKKDGRLTKNTVKYMYGTSNSCAYSWKGNYITKYVYKYSDKDYTSTSSTTYKYKNNKRVSYQNSGDKAVKIKWKGKTGTYSIGNGQTYKYTINQKGQLIKSAGRVEEGGLLVSGTYTYKYYANGNLKSITTKGKNSTSVEKFNKQGYRTSSSYKLGSFSTKSTYKYKTKNGKIREVVETYTSGSYTYSRKTVFNKWKKVSHVRNCDAWGLQP